MPRQRQSRSNIELSDLESSEILAKHSLPDTSVTAEDVAIFSETTQGYPEVTSSKDVVTPNHVWIPSQEIEIGGYCIQTLYSEPMPKGLAHPIICYRKTFVCQFCLKQNIKSKEGLQAHLNLHNNIQCKSRHPPGVEVYRKDAFSIFEVNGDVMKVYCQNLCSLSKLFLDNKTLTFDVNNFLFYVLTKYDKYGWNFLGYFSKENTDNETCNLSCLMVLPPFRDSGYGQLLIEFSYLLSKIRGKVGTPERPLSEKGESAYNKYWQSSVLDYFYNCGRDFDHPTDIKDLHKAISDVTKMNTHDVETALNSLKFIEKPKKRRGKPMVKVDWEVVMAYRKRKEKFTIVLDEEALDWEPPLRKQTCEPKRPRCT